MGCGASKNVDKTNKSQENNNSNISETEIEILDKNNYNSVINNNTNNTNNNNNSDNNNNNNNNNNTNNNKPSSSNMKDKTNPIVITNQDNNNNNESNFKSINDKTNKNLQNNPSEIENISNIDIEENKNENEANTNKPLTEEGFIEKKKLNLDVSTTMVQQLTPKNQFEKSTSSIQIDNNVDFTIIKAETKKSKGKGDNCNDDDSKADSKISMTSRKKRNKTNVVNDDLEILNVDDTEQNEGDTLNAQKPIGFKGDYYTMNQEVLDGDNENTDKAEKKQTEDDEYGEDDEEPQVITNSFFTEDENFKIKKEKKIKNNDNKSNKSKELVNSKGNSSTSLECEINDIGAHGKKVTKNDINMETNDNNGNTHPFSVF